MNTTIKIVIGIVCVGFAIVVFMQVQPTHQICDQATILDLNKNLLSENSSFLVVVKIQNQSQVIRTDALRFYDLKIGQKVIACQAVGNIIPNSLGWSLK